MKKAIILSNHSTTSKIVSLVILALSFSAQCLQAGELDLTHHNDDEPDYSIGVGLGSGGIGASVSGKTSWSFTRGDQIQWRVMASGLKTDSNDDIDFAGIDYGKSDISLFGLQAGIDWFPYRQGWAEKVYFSTGLMVAKNKYDGSADMSKSFNVGGKQVNPGNISSFRTEIDESGVLPYLSLGWGNKIMGKKGFGFQAEVGVAIPTSDADIKLSAVDPNNFLSPANLAAEKKDIEDDINGPQGFITATIYYQF